MMKMMTMMMMMMMDDDDDDDDDDGDNDGRQLLLQLHERLTIDYCLMACGENLSILDAHRRAWRSLTEMCISIALVMSANANSNRNGRANKNSCAAKDALERMPPNTCGGKQHVFGRGCIFCVLGGCYVFSCCLYFLTCFLMLF